MIRVTAQIAEDNKRPCPPVNKKEKTNKTLEKISEEFCARADTNKATE